jgi:hypothetical protein
MATYIKIASAQITPNSLTANIKFNNIPQTFTDLMIIGGVRTNRTLYGTDELLVYLNNDFSGTLYSHNFMRVQNGGLWDAGLTTAGAPWGPGGTAATNTAGQFGNGRLYIANYSSTTGFKSFVTEVASPSNATSNLYQMTDAGLWRNTAAVTSISFAAQGSQYEPYSTITIYGIKNS